MSKVKFDKELALKLMIGNEVNGEIKTEHGEHVRLLDCGAKGELPIVGVVDTGENELAMQWTVEGKRNPARLNTPSIYDLIIELGDMHE